jgi:septum formation protein
MKTIQILLGSKSPRRQQLLREMGLDFRLVYQDIDESYPAGLPVEDIAPYLAKLKAEAISDHLKSDNELILTCDTTVICAGRSYEKPLDAADATRILKALSGKTHQVMTAVCLKGLKKEILFSEITEVTFMELSEVEIAYYIAHYSPYDKAGAYAIQEWIGVNKISKINGSYYNVVGLPTHRIYEELIKYNAQ